MGAGPCTLHDSISNIEPWYDSMTVDYDSGMTVADSTTVMHDSQQDSCTTVNTTVIWQLVWQLHDSYTTVIRQLYDTRQLYDSWELYDSYDSTAPMLLSQLSHHTWQ